MTSTAASLGIKSIVWLIAVSVLSPSSSLYAADQTDSIACETALTRYPREIDPAKTFEALVNWIHDDIIVKRGAPGLVVGISGTDSLVAFLAIAKAYEKAGRPDRVAGVHFGPSEDLIEDNPSAESHLWFQQKVVPWLRKKAPQAKIVVDSSIDFRRDGLRWGALVDWSVVADFETRAIRLPEDRYWLVGTRNATEDALFAYSNASMIASVQVLTDLWKSEILQISRYLGVPDKAIEKSCEVDCACGRLQLPARNIPEVDALLMVRKGLLSEDYVKENIPSGLRKRLSEYIETQIKDGRFKTEIPFQSQANDKIVQTRNVMHPKVVEAIRSQITSGAPIQKPTSRLVAKMVVEQQSNIAADIVVASSANRENALPEALVLFNTPGLRGSQRTQMISSVYSPQKVLGPSVENDLASLSARLGNYAFSFPQWRYLTQHFGESQKTLAEHFGMQMLERANDIADASLPRSNPARDFLGRGYIWQDANYYIEYRRAYIVVSKLVGKDRATLVIRNSSHVFGRDRLRDAVYFSVAPLEPSALQVLTPEELASSGTFMPWNKVINAATDLSVEDKLNRAGVLLDRLDKFNNDVSRWLLSKSASVLLSEFFEARVLAAKATAVVPNLTPEESAPMHLGWVYRDAPSWRPRNVLPVTDNLVYRMREKESLGDVVGEHSYGERLVIMTGSSGDRP